MHSWHLIFFMKSCLRRISLVYSSHSNKKSFKFHVKLECVGLLQAFNNILFPRTNHHFIIYVYSAELWVPICYRCCPRNNLHPINSIFTIPFNKKSRTIPLECLSIINPGTLDSKSQEFQFIEALIKFQLSIFHSVPGTAPSSYVMLVIFFPFIWNLPLPFTL